MTAAPVEEDGLLALAERCEAATGADEALDGAILAALYGPLLDGMPYAMRCVPCHIQSMVPRFTASLDAAMTLVPEGHGWRLRVPDRRQASDDDRPFVTIWGSGRTMAPRDVIAATPALALTAAALRARARAQSGEGA